MYTAVVLAALVGGSGSALLGAVHALSGDERAYPWDWPARAGPVPVAVDPDGWVRRARWALCALLFGVLFRVVVVRLWT